MAQTLMAHSPGLARTIITGPTGHFMARTIFDGPKPVRSIEVLQFFHLKVLILANSA